jgi:4-hydroxy-tetrahydrodipicolinate synthase
MSNTQFSKSSLSGIVPALVTPFDSEEQIDYAAWQVIIDALIDAGVDGLFFAGGQGEFFSLSEEERASVLRFCKMAAAERVPVYGNVGCITTRASISLAQCAESEGLDFLVAVTPFYLKPSAEELVEHFTGICKAVKTPVLAYNVPDRTGVELTPEIVAGIVRRCENFVGLKDSGGKLEQTREFMDPALGRSLSVFMGRDNIILPGLQSGCVGAVTACANVAPRLFVHLYRAFMEGDLGRAADLQRTVDLLRTAFNLHTFPSVVKEAMEMAGLPAGPCRRPVGPMPPHAKAKLHTVIEHLRQLHYLPELP